jgi:membrane protein
LLAKYNAVYGSFAALPFFLIWLYLSWMIVLIGAQIAYAHQHVAEYAMQVDYQEMNAYTRKAHAMNILRLIVVNFEQGGPPLRIEEIAARLVLLPEMVSQLIDRLILSKMVSAVAIDEQEEIGYQPARDIHGITVAEVLLAWDKAGSGVPAASAAHGFENILDVLETLENEVRKAPANRLIKDI